MIVNKIQRILHLFCKECPSKRVSDLLDYLWVLGQGWKFETVNFASLEGEREGLSFFRSLFREGLTRFDRKFGILGEDCRVEELVRILSYFNYTGQVNL